jgi:tetratricopeptide (TPR) repeat protein
VADPNQRSEPETDDSAATEGEAAPAAERPATPKKKAKSSGDPEEIRDRNKRIREEAASKRRSKRESEERRAVAARNLDASEVVDDALARSTHAAAGWLKRNFNVVQWAILLAIVVGIGYQIYKYRHGITAARVTDELWRAVQDERARIGSEESSPDTYTGLSDTRPTFADDAARLKAASESYKKVESSGSATTSALAAFGLAGVFFDQGKYKDARAQYEKVKNSALASKDVDARARAIEGIGLSQEASGEDDAALASFKELGNSDTPGLAALGEYHQARLLLKKNQLEPAKALIKKAYERVSKLAEPDKARSMGPSSFLDFQIQQLFGILDPAGLQAEQSKRAAELAKLEPGTQQFTVPGKGKLDQKALQEMMKKAMAKPKGSAAPASSAP